MNRAEKAAVEIVQSRSSYNQLLEQLEGEQRRLLHKAWCECQILTLCQAIWHRKKLTCQAWRDSMHEWLTECVKRYNNLYGKDIGDE